MQEDWTQACEFAERTLQVRPNHWYAKAILIASLARSGRVEKAREMVEDLSAPFSIEQISWLPFVDKKWNDNLVDGLTLAGCNII